MLYKLDGDNTGSRSQSLLGLKVARAYPAAHVLSLMPTRGLHGADHQRYLHYMDDSCQGPVCYFWLPISVGANSNIAKFRITKKDVFLLQFVISFRSM